MRRKLLEGNRKGLEKVTYYRRALVARVRTRLARVRTRRPRQRQLSMAASKTLCLPVQIRSCTVWV